MSMLKKILNMIGNENLYSKSVIPALILEAYSRAFNDRNAKKYAIQLYKISRSVRALEEFIAVYDKTGDMEKAIDRAMQKIRKRYY